MISCAEKRCWNTFLILLICHLIIFATSFPLLSAAESKPEYMLKVTGGNYETLTFKVENPEYGKRYTFTCEYYFDKGENGAVSTGVYGNDATTYVANRLSSGRTDVQMNFIPSENEPKHTPFYIGFSAGPNEDGTAYFWNCKLTIEGSDDNILENPDFADGNLNGWRYSFNYPITDGQNQRGKYSVVPFDDSIWGEIPEEEYMLKVDYDGDSSSMYSAFSQKFGAMEEGTTYTFSFDYYYESDSIMQVVLYNSGAGIIKAENLNKNSVSHCSFEYTATADDAGATRYFGIRVLKDASTGYFWDFRLYKKGLYDNLLNNPDLSSGSLKGWYPNFNEIKTDATSYSIYTVMKYRAYWDGRKTGDIDDDGEINTVDIALLKKQLLGIDGNGYNIENYDINSDGNINIFDLIRIKLIILNQENEPQKGGADDEAEALRTSILNSQDAPASTEGTTYYISAENGSNSNDGKSTDTAWATINAYTANRSNLKAGDTVLFERGGIYRGRMILVSGVSYGAYGTGDKPAIYGSLKNYSDIGMWHETETENVWVCSEDIAEDVGNIVFNHGQKFANKKSSLEALTENYFFYYDSDTSKLYLHLCRNPSAMFYDIEICESKTVMMAPAYSSDISIDNLTVKYGGGHGIHFLNGSQNISVTNCEIAWIGGSILTGSTRFGNAIEFWNNCSGALVENNWIYQVYDAGITHQGGSTENGNIQENITYRGNLVEYCSYAIEYFCGNSEVDVMRNILIENNIFRFSGYGWGKIRPNPQKVALICGWYGTGINIENFKITNNIFDISSNYILVQNYREKLNIQYSGNSYYQRRGKFADWESYTFLSAYSQADFEASVRVVESSPSIVKYIR